MQMGTPWKGNEATASILFSGAAVALRYHAVKRRCVGAEHLHSSAMMRRDCWILQSCVCQVAGLEDKPTCTPLLVAL